MTMETAMYNAGTTINRTTKNNASEAKNDSRDSAKKTSARMVHIKTMTSATPSLLIARTSLPGALWG